MAEKQILTNAYRFRNGMVIAFDQNGQQMPEYQGRLEAVLDKITADYPQIEIRLGEMVPIVDHLARKK